MLVKNTNNSEKVESSSDYTIFPISLKLMIEVRLVTECSKYEEAWSKLLPQLWEHAKMTNPDCLCENFDGSPEELEAFDDGKHFIN